MPAGNPAGYADPRLAAIARQFNANPKAVGGFQAIMDDLSSFLGAPIAERPEGFVGPPSPMDFPPEIRERLARQAMGGSVDMQGVQNSESSLNDIMSLLKRMRGALPDQGLAERMR